MNYLILFITAFILSFAVTPIFKVVSFKLNILDRPNHRKIHKNPIPLLGGMAILVSFTITLLSLNIISREFMGILAGGFIFVIFGLLDDANIKMRARYKIWSHLLFSIIFIYVSGIQFTFFEYQWLNILLTVGFITFMTNSMNMLDGMDGLVSGISFLSAGFFAILAFNSGQKDIIILSFALMGACLGFLKYNFNPASIFLGEAGATFLGFILAIIAVKLNTIKLLGMPFGISELKILTFVIPVIVLGVPVFDTYFVFVNRFINRIKFSQPGRDHSHHRINLMGFSQKITVLSLYAIQLILGSIAVTLIRADILHLFALSFIIAVFIFGLTAFLLQADVYSSNNQNPDYALKNLNRS